MKQSTMLAWGAAAGMGALLLAVTRKSAATVSPVGEARTVSVGPNSYAIVALGGDKYSITDLANPLNTVVLSSAGVALRTGNTAQIEKDMQSFPSNLFSS
jgi:hypothetical protein